MTLSKYGLIIWSYFLLSVSASGAAAFELDNLLPASVPGYGNAPDISIIGRVHPEFIPVTIHYKSISVSPSIAANAGYDSNPNGIGSGSSAFTLNPSLALQADTLGFGAYLAGEFSNYPQAAEQNTSGITVALGERALLPRETLTVALAFVDTQETGFGYNTAAFSRPISASVKDLRGSDRIVLGMLTLTPGFAVTHYAFSGYPSQDRTDYRQSVNGEFASGGPARYVAMLQATESRYRQQIFNAGSYAALAGIADQATGLWQIRLAAGAATRQPAIGKPLVAPVLEASLSWMPSAIDSLTFDLAREIDDPDQQSAEGYTLSEASLSIAHEYLRNVIITGSFKAGQAVYFNSSLVETLFNALTTVDWHLNRALAVNAEYAFNDRQANLLRAANEHIITMGVTWTP